MQTHITQFTFQKFNYRAIFAGLLDLGNMREILIRAIREVDN